MIGMARAISDSITQLATWLLAGFSAAFALILANLDDVSKFVAIETIKKAVFLFLASLILAVLQRWLSTILQAGFQGGEIGEKLGAELGQNNIEVNIESVLLEVEKATFYPAKFLVIRQYKKVRTGDFTVGGRQQLKLAQVQGLLMLVQVVMAVSSLVVLVMGINA
jgi:hypothetical protein